ncbi:hypothetical protein H5T87_03315 [bacterium]|nr:hypothetical protein [bacterium]
MLTQRWYNAVVGRFVVRDPVRFRGRSSILDLYPYCQNNPQNMVDPEGTSSWQKLWGFPFVAMGGYGMVIGFLVSDCGFPVDRHLHWRPEFLECACLELKEAYKDLRCMGEPGPITSFRGICPDRDC